MKEKSKSLSGILLILGLGLMLALTACSQEVGGSGREDNQGDVFKTSRATITYVDENGNTLKTQTVINDYGAEHVYFDYMKTGYKCEFFDSKGNKLTSGDFTTSSDCKITVKATPITYTIKFAKPSYGTISGDLPADMTCFYDVEYTLPDNVMSCECKSYIYNTSSFKASGWSERKDGEPGNKGEYQKGAKVKNLKSKEGEIITLYACFSNKDSYELKFYKDETSYAGYTSVYADKDEILAANQIPSAVKTGYKLDGYYLKDDSNKAIIDFTTYKVSGTASFVPKFSAETFKATFVTEYGTAPKDVSWKYEDYYSNALTKDEYKLTAKGYNFVCWKDQDGYSTINSFNNKKNLTFTAQWTPWTAKIAYDKNAPANVSSVSGTLNSSPEQVEYNTAIKLTKCDFAATGYKFKGWNTKKDGSGQIYADQASYTWLGSVDKETITFYAQWEEIQLSVKIGVQPPANNQDISLTYESATKCFKAVLSGAASYTWYIDGKEVENETGSTLSVYSLREGLHTVMVTTDFSGRTYGQTMVVTVSVSE